jgi:hypothetical protein
MASVMKARLEVGEGFFGARNVCCGMVMVIRGPTLNPCGFFFCWSCNY